MWKKNVPDVKGAPIIPISALNGNNIDKLMTAVFKVYDAWNKYFNSTVDTSIGELTNLFKNINMDNVQKHINNAQKAINLIQELTSKSSNNIITKTPRPVTKFFGD